MSVTIDEIDEMRLSTLSRPPGKATHSRIMIATGNATPGGRSNTDDDVMATED